MPPDIRIEIAYAQVVHPRHVIQQSQARVYAEYLQGLDVRQQDPTLRRVLRRQLEFEWPRRGIDQTSALYRPASFSKQIARPFKGRTVHTGPVRDRQLKSLGKHPLGQAVPVGGKQGEFGLRRQASRGKRRVGEVAQRPRLRTVLKYPVLPLEIQRQRERLADPHIPQSLAIEIQHDRQREANKFLQGPRFHDERSRFQRRDIVRRNPMPNIGFKVDIEQPLANGLSGHRRVAIDVVSDDIEIVTSAVHRDIPSPVIFNAFVADKVVIVIGHPIGAAPHRRHQGVGTGVLACVIVRRSDGEPGQRHQVRIGEHTPMVNDHLPVVDYLQRFDP